MKLLKNNESGQVLVLSLVLLAFGSLVAVPMLTMASTGLNYHKVIENNTLGTYAADSGVEYAICRLNNAWEDYQSSPLLASFVLNGKSVSVNATYQGNNIYRIISTATTDSHKNTTIESYVIREIDYVMLALEGNINLSGYAEVALGWHEHGHEHEGDINICSNNGSIYLSGHAIVYGNAFATSNITVTPPYAEITGTIVAPTTPITFEPLDTSVFLEEANADNHTGDMSISHTHRHLGPKHITGSLTIHSSTVELEGSVWVDGTISISDDTEIEGAEVLVAVGDITIATTSTNEDPPEAIPLFISTQGNITVSGPYPHSHTHNTAGVLYASNGNIIISGTSKVCGSVVGQSITASDGSEVRYYTGIRHEHDLPGAGGVYMLTYNAK